MADSDGSNISLLCDARSNPVTAAGQKLAINKADLEKSAKRKEEESTWAEDTIDSLQVSREREVRIMLFAC